MKFVKFKNAARGLIRGKPGYTGLVLVPLALLGLYFGVLATDRYVSEARVIVERDSSAVTSGLDLGFLSLGGSGSTRDIELVKRFIESPAMLDHLDQTLGLRAHYASDRADYFSRLSATASREKFFKYYLSHIQVEVDNDPMTLDIAVEGFEPEYAQRVAGAMVLRAEQFVNDVGQSLAREQVKFVQGEVDKANTRLLGTANALIAYQNEHDLFSPELENQAVSTVIVGLQQELARQRTELKALQSYLSGSATEVIGAQKKILALEQQILQERGKQVRSGKAEALNDLLVHYKELEMTLQVSTDIYVTGLKSLEAAKLDASRKVKHLVMVSAPTLPESSMRPRRMYGWATAVAMFHILYMVIGIIVSIIKDHQE